MALKRVDTLVRRVQRRLGDLGQANVEKSDILDALTQTQFNIARDALAIKTTGTLNLTAGITSVSVSPSIYKLKILTPPSNWCVPLKHISDVDRWNEIISSPWTITDEFPYYVFTVTGLSTAPSVGSVWTNNTANFVVQSTNLSGSAPNITGTCSLPLYAKTFLYDATEDEVNKTAAKFYEMMAELKFIPNSPTLMNAGRTLGQLSACFVLPVEDSMEGIFDSLKNMALIHKSGGGTGFSFSKLRPKNDMVSSTAGVSSGPVSFMNIFNSATETVKQGGTRRGANMAILNIDHPDIMEFIQSKSDLSSLTNFNISVALTDSFMKAVENEEDYELKNPRNGEICGKLNAKKVYNLITEMAWKNGEPGIIFIDRINQYNPLKEVGLIESTNPCGEQPLLPYESCNLGSINLNKILKANGTKADIDFSLLKEITRDAVHFLDNVIDMNSYPLKEIELKQKPTEKSALGLWVMPIMLIKLGIPYDSEEAVTIAGQIMSTIQNESKRKSEELAEKEGHSRTSISPTMQRLKDKPLRNATTTTIAPTGTISIIADSSSGIEPLFALAYVRNVMDNNRLIESNPAFEEAVKNLGDKIDYNNT